MDRVATAEPLNFVDGNRSRSAAEERRQPAVVGHPCAAAHHDRDLDRAHLQPPPAGISEAFVAPIELAIITKTIVALAA